MGSLRDERRSGRPAPAVTGIALKREGERAVVELLRGGGDAPETELSEQERTKFLEATPTVQADHPRIRALAKKVVGDAKTPKDQAARLVKWLFAKLKVHYARNASTSLQVLNNMSGDCTEYALLFVSLARAAGIPARVVTGLVAFTAEKTMFGGHSWAEIHDGGRWRVVDPSWGETAVHAGHFRLGTGDDLSSANFMSRMKIEVRDWKARK